MHVKIAPSWHDRLNQEFGKSYFIDLVDFVKKSYANERVYPTGKKIIIDFDLCDFEAKRVVILGQDPYHGPLQANGLSFSVSPGVSMPPSLVNIFKEVSDDVGAAMPKDGNLQRWAEQGVLLLNATLTVLAGKPGSHQNRGWEEFTDAVIATISDEREHVVFMLWGNYAQKKGSIIDAKKHLILSSPHPSPYSANRGFLGNKHFSKANNYLQAHDYSPINW
ncbi:MAG: uracil-DNA glycosylase [Bacteroidota bacterium]